MVPVIYVLIRLTGKDETGYRTGSSLYHFLPALNTKTIDYVAIFFFAICFWFFLWW